MGKDKLFLFFHDRARFINALTQLTSAIVSVFLILTLGALTIFTFLKIWHLFADIFLNSVHDIAHDIAYIIVLIKAYRIVLFYLQTEHVSIKYIVEISIIAPAIELIFASQVHSWWLNVLFAVFGVANLIIYLQFQKSLSHIDQGRYDYENIDFKT